MLIIISNINQNFNLYYIEYLNLIFIIIFNSLFFTFEFKIIFIIMVIPKIYK
jgi:hypothetical protein